MFDRYRWDADAELLQDFVRFAVSLRTRHAAPLRELVPATAVGCLLRTTTRSLSGRARDHVRGGERGVRQAPNLPSEHRRGWEEDRSDALPTHSQAGRADEARRADYRTRCWLSRFGSTRRAAPTTPG